MDKKHRMDTTRENGSLYVTITQQIATIEFGHPSSNAMPLELLDRLTKTFESLSQNKDVNVILLKSEGDRAFCAGASFDALLALDNLADSVTFFAGFANVINAMRICKKPIIGRIQGKVVGGGVGLVAACDYCMATEAASIRLSELSIGIGPFVIEPAVSRKIGIAAMGALSFNPTKWQNAYWAKEQGLYASVFEDIPSLDKEVQLLVSQLASYNPEALSAMKLSLWAGTENWAVLLQDRAEKSGALALSKHTREALQKFKS